MSALWIVHQLCLNTLLLQGVVIMVSCMRWHPQILVTDQQQGGSRNILDDGNWGLIEVCRVVLRRKPCESDVLIEAARRYPISDVGLRNHVRYVKHWIPEDCSSPKVFEAWVSGEPAGQKSSVATSINTYAFWINYVLVILKSF